MSDEPLTSAGVTRWEAAVRAVLRADIVSLDATITDRAHKSTPLGWGRLGEQPEAVALLEHHIGH